MLELLECKFARNGLTNWKTFLTNIFENIIWHLFAGESHQVVKITVPYWAAPCKWAGRRSGSVLFNFRSHCISSPQERRRYSVVCRRRVVFYKLYMMWASSHCGLYPCGAWIVACEVSLYVGFWTKKRWVIFWTWSMRYNVMRYCDCCPKGRQLYFTRLKSLAFQPLSLSWPIFSSLFMGFL
jgi:hypothetical protein